MKLRIPAVTVAACALMLAACSDSGSAAADFTGSDNGGVSGADAGNDSGAGGDVGTGDALNSDADDSDANPDDTGGNDADPGDTGSNDAGSGDAAGDAVDTQDTIEDSAGDTADGEADAPGCEPGWAESFVLQGEIFTSAWINGRFETCSSASHEFVAAADMTLHISVDRLPVGSFIEVVDATGEQLGSEFSIDGSVDLEFETRNPGLHTILLQRTDGLESAGYRGFFACKAGCERRATRYPIVLVHGLAGTDNFFSLFDYFNGIKSELLDTGYDIYTPVTDAIGPSSRRSVQLTEQVFEILEESGADKVHLIGHSQGGIDIRYFSDVHGHHEVIASTTSLATPHHGIGIPLIELMEYIPFLGGQDFSIEWSAQFNEDYPMLGDYPRFSWAGRTCRGIDLSCQRNNSNEVVSPLFSIPYGIIKLAHRNDNYEGANDGLVPVQSAMWGEFLGILPADHLDEINLLLRATPGDFDPIAFFFDEMERLRALEL